MGVKRVKTNPLPATEQVAHSLVSGPPVSSCPVFTSPGTTPVYQAPPHLTQYITQVTTAPVPFSQHPQQSLPPLAKGPVCWLIILVAQTSVYLEEPPSPSPNSVSSKITPLKPQQCPLAHSSAPLQAWLPPCLRGDLTCAQLWFFQVRTNSRPNPSQPSAHTRVSTNTLDWPSETWAGFPGPCPSFPL